MAPPHVSVIIPTTRRHDLVQRALASVFAQTFTDFEIIVVVDGPNPQTVSILSGLGDPRVQIVQTGQQIGPGAARNIGASQARGGWLAFLDDDDEWLPTKLERQIAAAAGQPVLVTCRVLARTPHGTTVWPRRLYDDTMDVDDYLFDRRSLFRGEAHVDTSSLFLPRDLFERSRFGTSRHHEDTTLLLRLSKDTGTRMVMIPDALTIAYKEEERASLGSTYDWREMLAWAESLSPKLSPRAYSGYCLVYLGSQAARRRDYAGFSVLFGRAVRRGSPTLLQVSMFLVFWVIPIDLRQRLRSIALRACRQQRLA